MNDLVQPDVTSSERQSQTQSAGGATPAVPSIQASFSTSREGDRTSPNNSTSAEQSVEQSYGLRSVVSRWFRVASRNNVSLTIGNFASNIIQSACPIAFASCMAECVRRVSDAVAFGTDPSNVWGAVALGGGVLLTWGAAWAGQVYFGNTYRARNRSIVEREVSKGITQHHVSSIQNGAVRQDVQAIRQGQPHINRLTGSLPELTGNSLEFTVASVLITSINLKAGLVLLAASALPRLWLAAKRSAEVIAMQRQHGMLWRQVAYRKYFLSQSNHIREIKQFGLTERFLDLCLDPINEIANDIERLEKRHAVRNLLCEISAKGGALTAFAVYTHELLTAGLSPASAAQMTLVFGAIMRYEASIWRASQGVSDMLECYQVSKLALKLIDQGRREAAERNTISNGTDLINWQLGAPRIDLHNLSFSYPQSSTQALRGIDLTLEPGRYYAIVGDEGQGKTTLVSLICGLYHEFEGRILAEGHSLEMISEAEWQQNVGVLFQRGCPFESLTIREAIELGEVKGEKSMTVEEAARLAGADSFIEELRYGYDTIIGSGFNMEDDRCIDPSGGQLQLIAIARLFMRQPKIMILDEPTNGLGPATERHISHSLREMNHGSTRILLSHDYGTVSEAEHIIVVNDGRIDDQGTHDELLARDGIYRRNFLIQAGKFGGGNGSVS